MPIPLGVLAAGGGAEAGPAFELIQEQVLGTTSLITFSNIPQTYKHLHMRISVRSQRNAQTDEMRVRINGATTNYQTKRLRGNASNVVSESDGTTNSYILRYVIGSLSTTSTYSPFIVDFTDYTQTATTKTMRAFSGWHDGNEPRREVYLTSGGRFTTGAITSIEFSSVNAANLEGGSVFSLYGIRG